MEKSKLDSIFLAIWRRALNLPSLNDLTVELIRSWLEERKISYASIQETNVGIFSSIDCIVLDCHTHKACFPKVSIDTNREWNTRNNHIKEQIELWHKMEWFFPLWVPMGEINKLLSSARYGSKIEAIDSFNYHTSTNYSLAFQAVCIAQLIPKSVSLKKYLPIAREAYLAFYSGHRASSIAALIPTIEGALDSIVSEYPQLTPKEKINKVFDDVIQKEAEIYFDKMWTPKEYKTENFLVCLDERILFFSTFRNWLLNSFFQDTKAYNGVTWLNRHVFAHAKSEDWQDSGNFTRLIVALTSMGVIESWYKSINGVSLLFPEMNDDGDLLCQQAQLQLKIQIVMKEYEEKNHHKHGRLVPKMPTDDGVLHRKAILAEDCINDLVRPLRDSGYSIDVGEPDDNALYIQVTAKSENTILKITLLYSCATANSLYKQLASQSDVILYRGAPYHQEQYAYGISIHVGPVTGWQPPKSN